MTTLHDQALLHRAHRFLQTGCFLDAKVLCQQILAKNKNHFEAVSCLAEAETQLGDLDAGLDLYRKCVSIRPKSVEARISLAQIHGRLGQYDQAINIYQKILRDTPNLSAAIHGLANAYERSGEADAARELIIPFIKNGTEDAGLALVYATLELNDKRPQNAIDMLSRHLNNGNAGHRMYFALGKAYEQLQEFDRAFESYVRANQFLTRQFNVDSHREFTLNMMKVFSASAMKRLPRSRVISRLPVLVTGRPRSGTTLVGRIIGAHPKACDAGELPYLTNLTNRLSLEIGSIAPFPACAGDLDQEDVDRLGNGYIEYLTRLGGRASRVVDKNMTNVAQMGFVNLICPGALAILCTRDAIDCCFSIFAEPFSLLHTYAGNLYNIGLTHELSELIRQHWLRTLDMPTLEVRYEDTVADQEGVSKRIIEACGLDWDDACLKYYDVRKGKSAPSATLTLSYDQVRRPIYKSSLGRAQRFATHLGPLYDGLHEGRRLASEIAAELKLDWFGELPAVPQP